MWLTVSSLLLTVHCFPPPTLVRRVSAGSTILATKDLRECPFWSQGDSGADGGGGDTRPPTGPCPRHLHARPSYRFTPILPVHVQWLRQSILQHRWAPRWHCDSQVGDQLHFLVDGLFLLLDVAFFFFLLSLFCLFSLKYEVKSGNICCLATFFFFFMLSLSVYFDQKYMVQPEIKKKSKKRNWIVV